MMFSMIIIHLLFLYPGMKWFKPTASNKRYSHLDEFLNLYLSYNIVRTDVLKGFILLHN